MRARGKYGLTNDKHKRSAKFHRMRRKFFAPEAARFTPEAKEETEDEMDCRALELDQETEHVEATRKKRGQGNRKYPERKRKKVKAKTPEQQVHEERKRIFIERMLWGIRKKNRARPIDTATYPQEEGEQGY